MISILLVMVEFGEANLISTKRNRCLNLNDWNILRGYEATCELASEMNEIKAKSYHNLNVSCKLSSSNSLGALSSTTSTLSECGDDSDYGLYEYLEDDSNIKSKIATFVTTATSSSSSQANAANLVIYAIQNNHVHVSCRSFENFMEKSSSASISMIGERIVQDSLGLHAEYHVKMILDFVEYSSWKTFNDFEEMAKACLLFSNKKKSIWSSLGIILPVKKSVYKVSRGSTRLSKTVLAWDNVIHERFKRNWFKQLSALTLIDESKSLQYFLECLLFETPNIDILLEFLASN
jgi:hypothetical protein